MTGNLIVSGQLKQNKFEEIYNLLIASFAKNENLFINPWLIALSIVKSIFINEASFT